MNRFAALDGLRGILAIWVVICHLTVTVGLQCPHFLSDGNIAVDVFIILSGFVIFHLLSMEREKYGTFLVRRLLRLYPVYLICLLLAIALLPLWINAISSLGVDSIYNQQRLTIAAQSQKHFWKHLAAHLTLVHGAVPQNILPGSSYAFVGQAWSISLEWQFYLIAPALYLIIKRGRLLGAVCLVLSIGVVYFSWTGRPGFLPSKIHLFAVGIASQLLWQSKKLISIIQSNSGLVLLPSIIGLLWLLQSSLSVWVWALILFLTVRTADGTCNRVEASLKAALSSGPLAYLGRVSYPVYLVHMNVLCIGILVLKPVIVGLSPERAFLVLCLLVVPLTIGISDLLSRWIEQPCIRFGRTWADRRLGPAQENVNIPSRACVK